MKKGTPRHKKLKIGTVIGGFEIIEFVGMIKSDAMYRYKCKNGHERTSRIKYIKSEKEKRKCLKCKKASYSAYYLIALVYRDYKKKCLDKSRSFNLDIHAFEKLIKKNCNYCGSTPSNKKTSGQNVFMYNGIDRVDSSKGYSIENCVPCCKTCNYAKRDMDEQDFVSWIRKAYEYLHIKKGKKMKNQQVITEIIEIGNGDFGIIPGYYIHEVINHSSGNNIAIYRKG